MFNFNSRNGKPFDTEQLKNYKLPQTPFELTPDLAALLESYKLRIEAYMRDVGTIEGVLSGVRGSEGDYQLGEFYLPLSKETITVTRVRAP
ncbi:hypothetical protein A3K63_02495 [Candidatus Micrarchaeota archaeon RBG_16_49_10]|nr:MAG: hypothetical protein A3K63_02495 [Candidatus Micrarchaeota archaeon RBG_16_49_10]